MHDFPRRASEGFPVPHHRRLDPSRGPPTTPALATTARRDIASFLQYDTTAALPLTWRLFPIIHSSILLGICRTCVSCYPSPICVARKQSVSQERRSSSEVMRVPRTEAEFGPPTPRSAGRFRWILACSLATSTCTRTGRRGQPPCEAFFAR